MQEMLILVKFWQMSANTADDVLPANPLKISCISLPSAAVACQLTYPSPLGWHSFTKSFQNPGTRRFSHSFGPKDFKKSKFSHIDGRLPIDIIQQIADALEKVCN